MNLIKHIELIQRGLCILFLFYLEWAEKCNFLKKAIINNYFDSTCFYWIDAGYFRKEYEIGNYTNNWPSTKKCYEDKRFLLYQIRMIFENEKNFFLILIKMLIENCN